MNRTLLCVISVVAACLLAGSGSAAAAPAVVGPASAAAPASSAHAAGSCHSTGGRADRACTPGVVNPKVTQANIAQTVCRKGWTATVRPPVSYTESLKKQQMREYGMTGAPSSVEEDHLIPLELGGNPTDPNNLWPQPRGGAQTAHSKDVEENQLNKAVCNLRMTLDQARAKMLADWRS